VAVAAALVFANPGGLGEETSGNVQAADPYRPTKVKKAGAQLSASLQNGASFRRTLIAHWHAWLE
jgi:hypothetical protein